MSNYQFVETVHSIVTAVAYPVFWVVAVTFFWIALGDEDYKIHWVLALILLSVVLFEVGLLH
jgi:hypothetical protein